MLVALTRSRRHSAVESACTLVEDVSVPPTGGSSASRSLREVAMQAQATRKSWRRTA